MGRITLVLLTAIALLSGCDDPGGEDAPEVRPGSRSSSSPEAVSEWDAPSTYGFTVRSRCGEQSFIGTFRIRVEGGEVTSAKGLDESAKAAIRYMEDDLPTLSDLLDRTREARSSGAEVAEVVYDRKDGYPKRIEIDHDRRVIDDESCFFISDYSPEAAG